MVELTDEQKQVFARSDVLPSLMLITLSVMTDEQKQNATQQINKLIDLPNIPEENADALKMYKKALEE